MAFYYDFGRQPAPANRARTAATLLDMRRILDQVPPKNMSDTLLLASWNIMKLGQIDRTDESLWYIAEILSRFDLIAIQEVMGDLRDLNRLRDLLGPWWDYLVSDVTEGKAGNDERLAFLYDRRKVRFSGLAGEIVIEPTRDENGKELPAPQLARTPYLAGFKCGWFPFVIATVHLKYGTQGEGSEERRLEAEALAAFMRRRIDRGKPYSRNVILLGDFNFFSPQSPLLDELKKREFEIPVEREQIPQTNAGAAARYYDQIAYHFREAPHVKPKNFGVVEVFKEVYSDEKFAAYEAEVTTADGSRPADPERYYRTFFRRCQISDHYPIWAELPIEFGDSYLEEHRS